MSIPPLICSTPPPPDQCDDDKDPGDFDLSYNLNYDNKFDIEDDVSQKSETISSNSLPVQSVKNPEDFNLPYNLSYDNKFETDEDVSFKCEPVSDLSPPNQSKEDDDIGDFHSSFNHTNECDAEENGTSESKSVSNMPPPVPCEEDNELGDFQSCTINYTEKLDTEDDISFKCESVSKIPPPNQTEEDEEFVFNMPPSEPCEVKKDPGDLDLSCNNNLNLDEQFETEENVSFKSELESNIPLPSQCEEDNDSGDFQSYSFNFENKFDTEVTVKSEFVSNNPSTDQCEENKNSEDLQFSFNFEGKFDMEEDLTPKTEIASNMTEQVKSETKETFNQLDDDDDDFGDFDDFQSSSAKNFTESSAKVSESTLEEPQGLTVLNLQTTENEQQILERITNVLSSVFLEEITEPESVFEGKLESLLSETWGHLMETDERQPYIVNWNNSLGQNTLLKALCIDSRNILFGPKWSSSMPKYAANLSNAPLQPQKQASTSTSTQNDIVSEKPSSKATTWNDPFASDGHEFTYAESLLLDLEHLMATLDQMAHNHSTLKISELLSHACNTETESSTISSAPADLDVFDEAPPKTDKIFSNTIGVQPLRQISLPDTHIFTPTDSEIPRSKTIHYDHTPTVPLPQTAPDIKSEIDANQTSKTSIENNLEDNEYWEFGNFKSTSGKSPEVPQDNNFGTAMTINALPKPNIAYQTDLLQPIRVEPAMPTLNWPDPGEVKEVFDDFSDFVSISSQFPSDKQDSNSLPPLEPRSEVTNINKLDSFNDFTETEIISKVSNTDNTLEDDFDTFQSAPPTNVESNVFKASFTETVTNHLQTNHINEFDTASLNFDSMKSDPISFGSISKPNDALTSSISFTPNRTEQTNTNTLTSSTQMQTNLLQPIPTNFSAVNVQSQHKSPQILQPLSLESYSQINWPSPGIDLQDLSRFNPVETLHSLKSDLSVSGLSKTASPVHSAKSTTVSQTSDDDVWGEFVSSKPKQQPQPKKPSAFVDDDEWTDFISSPTVKPINGLNTISLNVHTNSSIQKSAHKYAKKSNQPPIDIPALNYITPKSNPHMSYNDKHFQNL